MWESFISYTIGTFLALFPIVNPVGAVPVFCSLTASNTAIYRRRQAWHITINVIYVLAAFLLAGKLILQFFGISLGVLRVAGGLLVAQTAWEMVTTRQRLTSSEQNEAVDKEDISFTPMAVPVLSGPGAIGVVISMAEKTSQWLDYLGCLVGIIVLGISVYLFLAVGNKLVGLMGKNGVGAVNRVLGFFILAIAVQFIAEGLFALIREEAPGLLQ